MDQDNTMKFVGAQGASQDDGTGATEPKVETTLTSRLENINQMYVEEEVAKKAKELGLGYVDLKKVPVNPDYLRLIPERTAREARIIPFFRIGNKLRVGVIDLYEEQTSKVVAQLQNQGYLVNINLVSQESFDYGISLYEKFKLVEKEKVQPRIEEDKIKTYEKEIADMQALAEKITMVTPEEALALLEAGAIKTNSSDIHLQPEEDTVRVRFRIDGVLHDIMELDHGTYKELVRQIKYKAQMKVNIVDIPQDGHFFFHVGERTIQVRVSSMPTDYGETYVMRILDSSKGIVDFQHLGFEGYNLSTLYRALSKSAGVVLLTGPTGSGKTTTLYSILDTMNSPEKKICTLEDPIEYRLPYLSQSQIDENANYTFAKGLRAILRQDPDVVMVGEIRDLETAEIAMQASLTGHVVLSTLHTNSSTDAISRLINMGVPRYIVAPGLTCVIAQRLIRKVCDHCAVEVAIPESDKEGIEKIVKEMRAYHPQWKIDMPEKIKQAKGCEECSHTGYRGQTALIEVFYVDQEIKDMIMEDALISEIREKARKKGMFTMLEVGMVRVFQGITTLSEVYRVGKV